MKNKFLTRLKTAITLKGSDFATIIITMLVIGIIHLIFGDFNKWVSEFTFLYSFLGAILGVVFSKLTLGK